MRITLIAGARPNFMKIAPILSAITAHNEIHNNIHYRLVHTGQHYDKNMSDSFFEQLGIPHPHANLESGVAHRQNRLPISWFGLRKNY